MSTRKAACSRKAENVFCPTLSRQTEPFLENYCSLFPQWGHQNPPHQSLVGSPARGPVLCRCRPKRVRDADETVCVGIAPPHGRATPSSSTCHPSTTWSTITSFSSSGSASKTWVCAHAPAYDGVSRSVAIDGSFFSDDCGGCPHLVPCARSAFGGTGARRPTCWMDGRSDGGEWYEHMSGMSNA